MKNITLRYGLLIIMATCIWMYACKKDSSATVLPYSLYGASAIQGQLKINYNSAYTANPSVFLKINGQVVSNLITSRTPFPGGGYNTNGNNVPIYLSVPLGVDTVAVVIPKSGTNVDSVVLYKTTVTIPDNSPYTLHIADTMVNATTNKTQSLLIKNLINTVNPGFCRFRFVNLIPNLSGVDVYLNGVLIKSNIGYLQATDTFSVATGLNAPGVPAGSTTAPTPTWAIRVAGASPTSAALASYASSNGLQSQFVLTGFFMGYSGATGTRLPYLSFTLDKNQY